VNCERIPTMLVRRLMLALLPLLLLVSCATPPRQPLQVNVASVERIAGQAMELRFIAQLRVQNPNDTPVEYTGASVSLELRGQTIGTGVTSTPGSVPRMSEALISVPVTVSQLGVVRQAIGLYGSNDRKLDYVLKGSLSGPSFGGVPFQSRGEMVFPLPGGS